MYSSSPFTSQTRSLFWSTRIGSYGHLLILLIAGILISPHSGAAQNSTTQQIQLEQGWNLASLHVQPSNPSFASIFDGSEDQISMIKNADGKVYLPSMNIEQITSWKVERSYRIYAETAVSVEVTGSRVASDSTPVVLHSGWNLVPFFPSTTEAVEEALVSIEESLVAVEDENGAQYDPSAPSSPLDSLRPGQGYKVYVDEPDTLVYSRPDTISVKTLDDALALQGVEVGSYVWVRGYYEPGDGGGGLFRVTMSGAGTDGGTVFAFKEDVSAQQSEQLSDAVRGKSLANTDLAWGTVEVEIDATSNERIIDTKFLHGHTTANWPSAGQHTPMIDHKTGTFADRTVLQSVNDQLDGSGFTVRYKHITSNRRLERLGVTNAVNIDWWGAKEADPQNPVNNWWRINWAINEAKEIYENQNLDWAYVDIPGHYYYRYLIRVQEGVKLRGTSNQTFGPAANGQPTHGKLTIMPGLAMNHQKDGFDQDHIHGYLRTAAIDLTHGYMTSKVGAEALEIDGNIDGNLAPIENTNGNYNQVQPKLQNGNNWNGFASKNTGAWSTPDGAVADFDDVYVHDFPGNSLGMNNAKDFSPSSNVRVGGAPRNHQLYRTNGLHDSWTIEGAGWSSLLKVTKGTFPNLTIDPSDNELKQYWGVTWFKVFDHHGKGFGLEWDGDSERISTMKIDVDDFSVDLTGHSNTHVDVFADRGYGGSYKNGSIKTPSGKGTTLLSPVGTSGNGPIRDYAYENITVTDQGGGVSLLRGGAHTHLTAKNITIQLASGATTTSRALIAPKILDASSYAEYNGNTIAKPLEMAARIDINGLDAQVAQDKQIISLRQKGAMPYDLFLVNSSVNNTTSDDAQGLVKNIGSSTLRVYLDNVTFNVYEPLPGFRHAGFHTYINEDNSYLRLRNCQDRSGRLSDESGTYTSDVNDEGNDYVLIPTSLMSLAQEKTATVTGGNRTVQSVENADANGNVQAFDPDTPQAFDPRDPYLKVTLDGPIQSGETITIDWTARVTPLEDYQTTGLFVARPVEDTTVTASAGPQTIDLRGVAASQESREPIEYTASSDSPGVATANVEENGYQFTVTPQSTGTATITVTGTIDGVGTTTDTFAVTVE